MKDELLDERGAKSPWLPHFSQYYQTLGKESIASLRPQEQVHSVIGSSSSSNIGFCSHTFKAKL